MQFLETPSADEAEVYRNLQVCLEMRQSYVFKEAVAPWVKEVISDPCTPKPNPNPFEFTPEGKSDVSFYVQETLPSLFIKARFVDMVFVATKILFSGIDICVLLLVISAD